MSAVLREHAEQQFAEELAELARADTRQRPPNWKLVRSPYPSGSELAAIHATMFGRLAGVNGVKRMNRASSSPGSGRRR